MAKKDFFISYTGKDEQWATWIAGMLEEANYTTIIQAWDFKPGESFVHNMHHALIDSEKFIAVLSKEYFESLYCQSEWENAFTKDPVGEKALFIPVRIDDVKPKGLLASRIYIDLFGKSDEEAKKALINGVSTKGRPRNLPSFPGFKRELKPGELPLNNLPSRNPYFTGRSAILEDVQKELETGREAAILQTQVFKGLGGVGKSELAKEYAFRHGYKYEAVWWVNAESEVSILQAYTDFAFKQKIVNPDEKKSEVIVDAVKYWMQHAEHNKWLFIFDNAESEGMLRKYFPVQTLSEQRHILITSRYTLWKYAKSIYVEVFSEEEASDFFFSRTGLPKDEAMQELVEALGRLPLALEHAAAYICVNGITYSQYLELYHKYGSELLKKKYPYDDALQTIYVTWQISIDKIGKESVRQLLNLCSFFASENIHDKWFSAASEFLPSPLQKEVQNDLDYNDVKAELKKFSLVKIENNDEVGKISIHQLVQQVVKDALGDRERIEYASRCIEILNSLIYFDFSTANQRSDFTEMFPHIVSVTGFQGSKEQENKIANLFYFIGYGFEKLADYPKALEWNLKANKIREEILGKEHPDTTSTHVNIAVIYYNQGDYSKALEWNMKALANREKEFGNEHPKTATIYNNIAIVYSSQGDYSTSLEWHHKALSVCEKVLGKEHPDTAITYSNIAEVYYHQDDYAKSLKWYQKALVIFEKVHGKEHPNTATMYSNLAESYAHQGNYSMSLKWQLEALRIFEKILGKGHPDTARTYGSIASIYNVQGNYHKALEWYQKSLEIREKVLGKNHPDTATTYNNIALVYYNQGSYLKAIQWYEKALEIYIKTFGEGHPNTAAMYANITLAYTHQENYPKALEWSDKALEMCEKMLGKEHTSTATTYNNIALIYTYQGNPKALEWYQKAVSIYEKVLGYEHPDTAITYNNIAGVYSMIGDYPNALKWYQKALLILERILGKEHPDIATIYNNIALDYSRQNNYQEALEWYQKALVIFEKILGKSHPNTQKVKRNIEVLQNGN